MYPAMYPQKPYMIEIRWREFVMAVPTEMSHQWWEVIEKGPDHKHAIHRSGFRRLMTIEKFRSRDYSSFD